LLAGERFTCGGGLGRGVRPSLRAVRGSLVPVAQATGSWRGACDRKGAVGVRKFEKPKTAWGGRYVERYLNKEKSDYSKSGPRNFEERPGDGEPRIKSRRRFHSKRGGEIFKNCAP